MTEDEVVKARHEAERTAKRTAFIQAMRDCADFLDQHPTVNVPYNVCMNVFVNSKTELATHARAAAWEKTYNGDYFSLRRAWGDEITYEINASRETVCRKVVIGKRVIPARPEQVIDDVEYICDEASLLAEAR